MTFIPVKDYFVEVSEGNVTGAKSIHKFGRNIDADTGVEDIIEQSGTMTYLSSPATHFISSSNAGDTTQVVTMEYLDTNWDEQSATATLNGQNQVQIGGAADVIRVNRAWVDADVAGDVYIAESDTLTGGVPDTATKVRIKIAIGKNQSLNALYSVPNGMTAHILGFGTGIESTKAAEMEMYIRPFGEAFRIMHDDVGATDIHGFPLNKAPIKALAKSDIVLRATATANNTQVTGNFSIILITD